MFRRMRFTCSVSLGRRVQTQDRPFFLWFQVIHRSSLKCNHIWLKIGFARIDDEDVRRSWVDGWQAMIVLNIIGASSTVIFSHWSFLVTKSKFANCTHNERTGSVSSFERTNYWISRSSICLVKGRRSRKQHIIWYEELHSVIFVCFILGWVSVRIVGAVILYLSFRIAYWTTSMAFLWRLMMSFTARLKRWLWKP